MDLKTRPPLSIGPGDTLKQSLSLALATSASLSYLMKMLKSDTPVDVKNLILTKLTVRRCCMLWKFIHEDEHENIASYASLMEEAWKSKRFSYSMFSKTKLTPKQISTFPVEDFVIDMKVSKEEMG